jgi:lysophospholipase L1-like esterase
MLLRGFIHKTSGIELQPMRTIFFVAGWMLITLEAFAGGPVGFDGPPPAGWKFDFDPLAHRVGYTEVLPATIYTEELGYGFDFGTTASSPPFYFSVRVPEGNYNVKVTLGDRRDSSITTVKVECRRLMVERVVTAKGKFTTQTFTVHVRDSIIRPGGVPVRLKSREYAFLHWDNKLTLEFSNTAPHVSAIEIEPAGQLPTVFLAGNSTVVDQAEEPWAAWGQMIPVFFQPGKIAIANYAESGETLKAFAGERRLAKIWSMARPGDYLFIEFAHNDQKAGSSHLDPFTTYKEELSLYIGEARKRGMIPVLVTSMHRRNFDGSGHVINTLGDYPEAMRQEAKELNVGLVDLNAMSRQLYEAWGPEQSVHAFVHYPAHTFPGQEQELKDDTHFNSYGAYELAKCVVKGIKENIPELAKYLVRDLADFDPNHPDPLESWSLPMSGKITVRKPDGN